jgi:hypothetical protein
MDRLLSLGLPRQAIPLIPGLHEKLPVDQICFKLLKNASLMMESQAGRRKPSTSTPTLNAGLEARDAHGKRILKHYTNNNILVNAPSYR